MQTIQSRIAVGAGAAVMLTVAILAVVQTYSAYESKVEASSNEALAQARQQAAGLKRDLDSALDTARTLADALAAVKSREQVVAMLREVASRNSGILGVYTAWEPNAFDGKDAEYAGKPGHDAAGRLLPYLVRNSKGEIGLEPLADLENQERGPTGVRKGEYYLCAKEGGAECVLNPYPYPIDGKETLLTSLVAPIVVDGRFLGIAGVDIQLGAMGRKVDEVSIAGGKGELAILSNNGRLVAASRQPGLAGRAATEYRSALSEGALGAVFQGADQLGRRGEELVAVTGMQVGRTRTPWAVATMIPYGVVTAAARGAALRAIGIGLLVGLAAVLITALLVVKGIKDVLLGVTAQLGESAGQVSSASAQVLTASEALAQGASEQAAAIEETSASVTEVHAMASKNADNASSALELMEESLRRIDGANQRLERLVGAMSGIEDSSARISKINRTIDEIAFQTNILALNAAVEAARAGAAGMGFAVVADEVRTLAQRSAQAAKETAELISESGTRASDGRARVDEVAEAIGGITSEAGQVKKLVEQVSAGSREQAIGLDQIRRAIGQMEQVTQRSAAGAEECAAASQQMASQSDQVMTVTARLEGLVGARGGAR